MKMNSQIKTTLLVASLALANSVPAVTIEIQADHPGAKINPAMWGIFFEDISFGADAETKFCRREVSWRTAA